MSRKIAFALTALVLTLATGVTAAFAGPTRGSADPGVTSTSILLGTHLAALGRRLGLRLGGARRGRVLQVRQRARRRQRPEDPSHDPRRRVQPGADGAGDAAARRAGQGLRDLQRARHRAEPRDARLPERAEGAAALRGVGRDGVRQRDGASTRTRSGSSRATRPRAGCWASTSRARRARPRSPCSSRTTTTARTSSTG